MIRDTITVRTRTAYACFPLEIGKPLEVCIVKDCRRTCRGQRMICARHMMQKWRREHPVTAQYARLKAKARKRKKAFDITPQEWAELCRLTRYHEGTAGQCGSVREGLTIDRIRHTGGYTLDNVCVIVQRLNSMKGAQEMQCRLKNGKHVLLRDAGVSVAEELRNTDADLEQLIERI